MISLTFRKVFLVIFAVSIDKDFMEIRLILCALRELCGEKYEKYSSY